MNIGARIIKTGLSVTLAIIIANFLGLQPAVLCAVAAVIAVKPSVGKSWEYLKEVVVGNIIGAIFATVGFYLFGTEPVYIGLIVVLTIAVNLKLGLNKSINLSLLTVISILTTSNLHDSTLSTAVNRLSIVGLGVLASFLINVFILPPKHDERYYELMKSLNTKLITLMRIVPQKEISLKIYKQEKTEIDRLFDKSKDLYEILEEEKNKIWRKKYKLHTRKLIVFRQMLKVAKKEIVLVEKIEKHLNTMSQISLKQSEDVKNTLNELLHYQESIFLMYEDKVLPKTNKQSIEKRKKIVEKLKCTVNLLMKHYDPANEALWWRLFPIINALIETENELEKLESMVTNYKLRQRKNPAKKKKTITNTIKKLKG
ncbi:aromatic acid exporter family protein [Bacillus mexicanus]|uniref:FUSC family protein n=1 Tax=Bacillus mexicanus TaxID=2834415 RepID=UPI003D19A59E